MVSFKSSLIVTLPVLSSSFVAAPMTRVRVIEGANRIFSTTTTDVHPSRLTIAALKVRLRQLNLPLGGNKDVLVKRLLDYSEPEQKIPQTDTVEQAEVDETHSIELSGDEDCVQNLTVPALKSRLRELGLPLGGRKADLIKRLNLASIESEQKMKIDENDDDLSHSRSLSGDVEDGVRNKERTESSTRRAKRKKFWKTQEVRDLIKQNDLNAVTKAEEMITQLERMAIEEDNDEYLPGPIQYTTLIEAYSRGGNTDAPGRAEKVINHLLNTNIVGPTTPMLNASKYRQVDCSIALPYFLTAFAPYISSHRSICIHGN